MSALETIESVVSEAIVEVTPTNIEDGEPGLSYIKTAFKTAIPLVERNDWQDYFETEQHKIATLNQQIKQLEQQLDQSVYALFDLTPEEIELLQQNI